MDDDIVISPNVWTRQECERQKIRLEEEYENPSIPKDHNERLQNAILYVQVRNWPQRKAAEKAGISKSAVDRYVLFVSSITLIF